MSAAAPTTRPVEVVLDPHTRNEHSFNLQRPPPEMREALRRGLTAITYTRREFLIEITMLSTEERPGKTDDEADMQVASAKLRARSSTTILLPDGAPDTLRRHEDA
ncbi:MAG TPA: hypothetical protein VF624_01685, partial [Tepidisphaeraceae bacterium]